MQKLNLIGLLGKSCAGKDTAGRMLVDMAAPEEGRTMAFADKLKEITGEMFGLSYADMYDNDMKTKPTRFPCLMCPECRSLEVTRVVLDRKEHGQCRVCGTLGDIAVFSSQWTPRTILQYLGTEGFRRINPNVWVDYLINTARERLASDTKFIAVTDCRFISECEGIWAAGGEVWRLRRPETDNAQVGIKGHASEMELESIPDSQCQAVIQNTGTLDALRGRLHVELNRFLR